MKEEVIIEKINQGKKERIKECSPREGEPFTETTRTTKNKIMK